MSPRDAGATAGDRVLALLAGHPEGATDREISNELRLPGKTQANTTCRGLKQKGQVKRIKGSDGAIRNFPVDTGDTRNASSTLETVSELAKLVPDVLVGLRGLLELFNGAPEPNELETADGPVEELPSGEAEEPSSLDRPWYWEGNVQNAVAVQLRRAQYDILRAANTATREHGRDIEAHGNVGQLWVTVKGYPEGTDRTPSDTQAPHWFKDALYDIVTWRGEDNSVLLAIALPDFPIYRKMAERVTWLQPVARFGFIWVNKRGKTDLPREIAGGRR